jgi:CRISPR-associated protein Cmr4
MVGKQKSMKAILIGMLAETFIHPGIGQAISGGADLPVARERTTDYPFIPGSGKKGGWKSWGKEQAGLCADSDTLFGKADSAGAVMFSDARLLLLPVRSLNTAYVWLTCPLILERLQRDIVRISPIGTTPAYSTCITVPDGKYLSAGQGGQKIELMLEEREFERGGDIATDILCAFEKLLPASIRYRLNSHMVIIGNDDFAWFAKYALPVSAHNQLDPDNKTSKNLWYEETLPPDTLMYAMLIERQGMSGGVKKIDEAIATSSYGQFGGNETLGQGWFQMTVAHKA